MSGPRRLSWSEWPEVVRILLVLAVVEVGVRVATLPRLAQLVGVELGTENDLVGPPLLEPLPAWAARRLRLTRSIVRRLYRRPACLRTSLVAGNRLRRLHPKLRIGVRRIDARLVAHAWLEIAGHCFDPEAAGFQPLVAAGL